MNRLLTLLLFTLIFCIVHIGCGGDNPTQIRKNQKGNKKAVSKKKKTNAKPLPPIAKLKKINKQTLSFTRFVNDKKILDEKQPILVTGEKLIIKGNAIDQAAKATAAGVYIKIGKQTFKAKYGTPNRGLAERLKNDKYLKSGFTANIPTAKLKKGIQEVIVLVVAKNRKGYYQQKDKVKINVK